MFTWSRAAMLAGMAQPGPTPLPARTQLLERFERSTELPLLVLAVAMIPLLIVPLLVDLPDQMDSAFIAADWFIWAVFAIEYCIRLVLSPSRLRFVRREWPDLLIIALPFLRPLRIVRSARALRLLRLARLATFLAEATRETRRLLYRHKLHYSLFVTLVAVVGAAGLTYALEEQEGATIDSFADALWWASTTVTTVGYGDTYPVTPAGRAVAVVLMVAGITMFGLITANLAAFLLERDRPAGIAANASPPEEGFESLHRKLDEALSRLAVLESRLPDGPTR